MSDERTLVHQLRAWASKAPDDGALRERTASGWNTITWRQYDQRVRQVGRALLALGHQPGEAVGIVAKNRYELVVTQLGVMNAGGVPVPIYKTSTPEQIAWILDHAGARLAVVDGAAEASKLDGVRAAMPRLEKLILFDAAPGSEASSGFTMAWPDFLAKGAEGAAADKALEARLAAVDPDALAFLCYTSGTTGRPKGVMLTHATLTGMSAKVLARFGHQRDRILSYLPLSHIAEQIFSVLLPLAEGAEVFFCDDLGKLRDYLPEVRPTLFLGVPRVWEKFQAALTAKLAEATGVKAKLARWAMATELEAFKRHVSGSGRVSKLRRGLAHRLVLSKIHARLGLDAVRTASTGSAPTPPATLEFFASLGLPLHEGYGQTETSGLLTTSLPGRPVVGTVGKALDGIELRLAEDGEILARGSTLAKGYYKDEEQTRELWADGWLHTGDIGELDASGTLRITDRKKELIKTSGGKYVAPGAMEARFKSQCPYVSQMVVHGDNRNFCSALIAFDEETLRKWATAEGVTGTYAELGKNAKVQALFQGYIDQLNKELPSYSTIKKFIILPKDLTEADGDLTPSQKLKRKHVEKKFKDQLDQLYVGAVAGAD